MDRLNPCLQVKSSCLSVVNKLTHVKIVDSAITAHAVTLSQNKKETLCNGVEWDACGWHYNADVNNQGPLTVQFIFVMDAMNFCFWPSKTNFEYDCLASSLKAVLERDRNAFNADRLASITEETLASWFPVENPIPAVHERVIRIQELGQALLADFDGCASNIVKAANGSAAKLVQLVLRHIPGFRDTVVYKGTLIHFYKRAQILVGDIWAAYGRSTNPNDLYHFRDIDQLTMFADYRVPQILRHMGILQYSDALTNIIDNKLEVTFGSDEETEIRVATIVAVERLQKELLKQGLSLFVCEVDWLLWQWGESIKDDIAPHHRTLTIYY